MNPMTEPNMMFNQEPTIRLGTSYGILEEREHRNISSSYLSLLSTLLPLLVISIPLFFAFLFLRVRLRRVYAPRTFLEILHDEEKTPRLEKIGFINWIPEFWAQSDEEVLDHQNLDGYLFIRFLRTIAFICLVGFCLTIPLLVVNYTGGGGKSELASLTLSNILNPNRYYWHCLIAWIFFVYIMYSITRETIYYINLRYAFHVTPRNSSRVSSRTVLFTSVPTDWQNEQWLRAEFDQVERVWVLTDCQKLQKLIDERDSAAFELEDAGVKLASIAVQKSLKGEARSSNIQGSITAQYVNVNERPTKRSPPIMGWKEDTINSSRSKLHRLIPKVKQMQETHFHGHAGTISAAFIQFKTQRAAQAAFQSTRSNQPGHMEPACVGTVPEEVIWDNLDVPRWSRIVRNIVANIIIVLLILFWSIPVGLVGSLAGIGSLGDRVPFLSFVNRIPVPILGAITGLLPALLVSALLAFVPIICRFLATKAGAVTLTQVELYTQSWYFAFQVVQIFLVTTFSSGASAIAKEIVDDPAKAPSLLAKNLPQASNFYLSYFMLQGITVAASEVFQVVPLFMFTIGSLLLDPTPRSKFNRWTKLRDIRWGDTYPKLTNLAVIAFAYSCVSPLALGFASLGLTLLYLAFRYNVFYTLSTTINTKGDAYARALQQLTVGIYLAELCLVGLFSAGHGSGPAQLMILLLLVTIIYQLYLNWVLSPLMNSLSDRLLADDEEEALENGQSTGQVPSLGSLINNNLSTTPHARQSIVIEHRNRGGYFAPYLFHGSKSSYPLLLARLRSSSSGTPTPSLPKDYVDTAYLNPAVKSPVPKLWIVKDNMGISAEQIQAFKSIIEIEDKAAWFGEKGEILWDQDHLKNAPIWKERLDI